MPPAFRKSLSQIVYAPRRATRTTNGGNSSAPKYSLSIRETEFLLRARLQQMCTETDEGKSRPKPTPADFGRRHGITEPAVQRLPSLLTASAMTRGHLFWITS